MNGTNICKFPSLGGNDYGSAFPNTKSHSKCQGSVSNRKNTLIAPTERLATAKQTEKKLLIL